MVGVEAWAPCHITGFFAPVKRKDPLRTGSIGGGVSLGEGVKVEVLLRGREVELYLNGESCRLPTSEAVVEEYARRLGRIGLVAYHWVEVPVGAGLGSSGAGALALSFALNEALGRPFSDQEAAQIAHIAELRARTGLGTVLAEYYGGLELRREAGAPGVGVVEVREPAEDLVVAHLHFGSIATAKLLSDRRFLQSVARLGRRALEQMPNAWTEEDLMRVSRWFSDKLNIYPRKLHHILPVLDMLDVTFSMVMLGEGLFTITTANRATELREFCEKKLGVELRCYRVCRVLRRT